MSRPRLSRPLPDDVAEDTRVLGRLDELVPRDLRPGGHVALRARVRREELQHIARGGLSQRLVERDQWAGTGLVARVDGADGSVDVHEDRTSEPEKKSYYRDGFRFRGAAMRGTLPRAREALRSADFSKLFAIRLVSQFGDGLFQAALISSLVFSPEKQTTTAGFAKATIVVVLPFSVIGPVAGVFIDRWSRRRILLLSPLLRVLFVPLVLFNPIHAPVLFYAGALLVLSVNRFYLATAQAVVPRLVPTEDLLIANSLATVGGTVGLLAGVVAGGQVADTSGSAPFVGIAAGLWVVASAIAARIRSDLAPHRLPTAPLRSELQRIGTEFADGMKRLARAP